MSERINHRMLPPNVRMATEEAYDLGLEQEHVFICDICHVFLLNEERAFNHKKCIKKSLPVSKNVTVPIKHTSLQPVPIQSSIVENNKNDAATTKHGVIPSTSNQSHTPVCTNGQCDEVVDDAYCYVLMCPDDATSDIELNEQQIYVLDDDEIPQLNQLTACEKVTIGEQSKLIKMPTSRHTLLKIPISAIIRGWQLQRLPRAQ